jgi:hypothetical protein
MVDKQLPRAALSCYQTPKRGGRHEGCADRA